MNHLIAKEGLQALFVIDSAGTAGYHIGNRPDLRMGRAAKARGIAMGGRARQVNPSDFSEFDWIFAMDRSNYEDLVAVRSKCDAPTAKLVLFCDFCESSSGTEVPDPYYGGPGDFEKVLDLLEDGCSVFLRKWKAGELD